ncbi:MAG TPA: hypothetical protein VG097_08155 [Gemmata sp.]|nr:hypothetical protein [Gemmata sp.]
MPKTKPIRYTLQFSEGCFANDTARMCDSSTPFVALSKGDYLDRNLPFFPNDLQPDEVFKVKGVMHSFQELGTEIVQYVHVCVERTKRPE